MNTGITCIILTKNEEKNIRNCIESIKDIAEKIYIVDSGSTDNTINIANKYEVEVVYHEFTNYANQFNWALDNLNISTKWVYRIDADEIVTKELANEIVKQCKAHNDDEINGFIMNFKIYFMGKFLRYGGVYPFHNLTIFKYGLGRYEEREMGEHVVLDKGKTIILKNDCLHYDYKGLDSWIIKHLNYANREVNDISFKGKKTNKLYFRAKITSILRDGLYYNLPLFFRAKIHYIYRYYFRLGFLDGKEGKIYAFLQAYWYRFYIDAKILEKRKNK